MNDQITVASGRSPDSVNESSSTASVVTTDARNRSSLYYYGPTRQWSQQIDFRWLAFPSTGAVETTTGSD